jgi:hypothetical protein
MDFVIYYLYGRTLTNNHHYLHLDNDDGGDVAKITDELQDNDFF